MRGAKAKNPDTHKRKSQYICLSNYKIRYLTHNKNLPKHSNLVLKKISKFSNDNTRGVNL